MAQPLHIKNAFVWDGFPNKQRDLYTSTDGRITDKPANSAHIVDLDGCTIFPGLINAHDHLELNHYPRSKFRERYDNAHQWGEDMNVRLDTEPYKSLRAYPLEDKLLIGGLKNLLCGATTVAHHGPPHKPMFRKDFPVRVLREYGWAHSLHFDTDEEVVRSYRSTPENWPWFIHLAEGTDEVAAGEYQRLNELECLRKNTILVHGVGLNAKDGNELNARGLVVCPSTNQYLLQNVPTQAETLWSWSWVWDGLALGSDSRLTADGDLLDEMRFAFHNIMDEDTIMVVGIFSDEADQLLHMVTSSAAHLIRCTDIGELRNNFQADFIAISSEENDREKLCNSHRTDLALVVRGGIPQIGNADMMAKFPHIETIPATLDGKPKAIHRKLAQRIWKCTLKESGLEIDEPPKQRKYILF
jgi:cytosine/adenosine deaminase-related metal-dependent hydrolase